MVFSETTAPASPGPSAATAVRALRWIAFLVTDARLVALELALILTPSALLPANTDRSTCA